MNVINVSILITYHGLDLPYMKLLKHLHSVAQAQHPIDSALYHFKPFEVCAQSPQPNCKLLWNVDCTLFTSVTLMPRLVPDIQWTLGR